MPCQPGRFRPHASYLRKEARCRASAKKLPKGTSWKGFLWTLPETEGPWSLWHPGAARHGHVTSRAWLRTFERLLVGGYDKFVRPDLAQSKFPLEISLRGQSPRKDFCRAKMPCGGERLSGLLLGSLIVECIAYQIAAAIQNESAGKNRRRCSQGRHCLTRTTGIAQGSADPCVMLRGKRNNSNFFAAARHRASLRS